MNKTTKILLSLIGLGAIIVPAVLLVVLSPKINTNQRSADTNRSIDSNSIQNIVNQTPQNNPIVLPTPTFQPIPASPSAKVIPEGSSSAQ
jgi:hypothetical protein